MILLPRVRRISTKLRQSPYTETIVTSAYGIAYEPSIEVLPGDPAGTFIRGQHTIRGWVFSFNSYVAETLFAVTGSIDLVVRYVSPVQQNRKRTFGDIIFAGRTEATEGLLGDLSSTKTPRTILFGVPFVVQIPSGETIADHVTDEDDS